MWYGTKTKKTERTITRDKMTDFWDCRVYNFIASWTYTKCLSIVHMKYRNTEKYKH